MNILGISAFYHDSAAALFQNGWPGTPSRRGGRLQTMVMSSKAKARRGGAGGFVARVLAASAHFLRGLGFLLTELWGFMGVRRRYWLAPVFAIMLIFGLPIAFVQNAAVAQFIYTLF